MKVTSAKFVLSAFDESQWPRGPLPEVAFLGRSNVGKSSLINSLLRRKGLARTSNTPGRTQSINFYLINAKNPVATSTPRGDAPTGTPHALGSDKTGFWFADLPGYGY